MDLRLDVSQTIRFRTLPETPAYRYCASSSRQFLVWNPCDGYDIRYAYFDDETKEFEGFCDFMGEHLHNPEKGMWAELEDIDLQARNILNAYERGETTPFEEDFND